MKTRSWLAVLVAVSLFAGCQAAVDAVHSALDTPAPPTGSSEKAITQFKLWFNGTGSSLASINEATRTISATVPHGTDWNMLPSIQHTGVSMSPEDDQWADFSHPIVYTVKAADGSTQGYTVEVSMAASPVTPKTITSFGFPDVGAVGSINEAAHTIAVTVPQGTALVNLAPAIIPGPGAAVSPPSGAHQDFSQAVVYTVTGADGLTQDYTVTVTVNPLNHTKDITAFSFPNLGPGVLSVTTIGGTLIGVAISQTVDLTALVPAVTHTGVSVTPASGQATNFTNPVVFTVTAQDGTTKAYTVVVLMH